MLSLRAARHVRYQSQDHGGVVVLDTAAGLWIALNTTAGDFWRSWESGAGFDAAVAAACERYPDVPAESVRADAMRLAQDLVTRGLLEAVPGPDDGDAAVMAEPAGPGSARGPGWLRLLAAMACVVAASVLVRCPFRVSFAVVRASRPWCRRTPTDAQAGAAVAAVSRAARSYPGRAACLELSLAAVLLAAIRRWRLDWCLGSAPDPYRFHAWVEVEGKALSAAGEILPSSRFARILAA